jgi:hypothetical protein
MQRKSERLFRIYQRLKSIPQTIEELYRWSKQADLGISRRTLYRYVEELENAIHEPDFELVVTNQESKEKKWHIVHSKRSVDRRRRDAIRSYYLMKYLSGNHIHSLSAGFLDVLEQDFHKNADPDHHNGILPHHLIATGWSEANYSDNDAAHLLVLIKSIEEKQFVKLELTQQLAAEAPVNGIHEWAIHFIISHRGSLYVAAIRKGQQRIHFMELDSMISVIPAGVKYRKHIPKSEVDKELSKRFGITASEGPVYKISILFKSGNDSSKEGFRISFIQNRTWHTSQKFIPHAGGGVILQFKSQLNSELLGWLLMWMDAIEVLGPPQLLKLLDKKISDIGTAIQHGATKVQRERKPPKRK